MVFGIKQGMSEELLEKWLAGWTGLSANERPSHFSADSNFQCSYTAEQKFHNNVSEAGLIPITDST